MNARAGEIMNKEDLGIGVYIKGLITPINTSPLLIAESDKCVKYIPLLYRLYKRGNPLY